MISSAHRTSEDIEGRCRYEVFDNADVKERGPIMGPSIWSFSANSVESDWKIFPNDVGNKVPDTDISKYSLKSKWIWHANGVAKRLKSYAHQRETIGSIKYSLQLRPFSKLELLLKERICSQRERILSFMSSSF